MGLEPTRPKGQGILSLLPYNSTQHVSIHIQFTENRLGGHFRKEILSDVDLNWPELSLECPTWLDILSLIITLASNQQVAYQHVMDPSIPQEK